MMENKVGVKIKKKFKQFFSMIVRRRVTQERLDRCKLVMTLLVKNEADVIRQNIEFHLRQGVDFIVATDNVSTDGTYEILQEYEEKGVLYLIEEKSQDYDQAAWVNRMGKIACERFGANLIFHCDADEFWFPKNGNLKLDLLSQPFVDIFEIEVKNVLLKDQELQEEFPDDALYVVSNPIFSNDIKEDSKNTPFFLFRYPPKVMYKIPGFYLDVGPGNHRVVDRKQYVSKASENIIIYHFPVRGRKCFFDKVIQGGAALEKNTTFDENAGWHWRRWYALYKEGCLDAEYKKLNLSGDSVKEWIHKGVVVEQPALVGDLGLGKVKSD